MSVARRIALLTAGGAVLAFGIAGGAFGTASAPGTLGELKCISDSGSGHDRNCASANGIANAAFLAISPNGKNVYVTGRDSDSIAVFTRDRSTGDLAQLPGAAGCISDAGSGHDANCAAGQGLDRASGVAVSGDGRFVYVAANSGDAIALFGRDVATGALTQIGCIAEANPACTKGKGLRGAISIAITPDGANLYVAAASSNAVVTFARDVATGGLTELGCVTDLTSPDPDCVKTGGLNGASWVAVAPDGRNVYVASPRSSAVAAFTRTTGGALLALGCLSGNGGHRRDKNCAPGRGLEFVQYAVVSPEGKYVYVSATDSHVIAGFARDPNTGALTQLGHDGCLADFDYSDADCVASRGISLPLGLTFSADHRFLYTGAFGYGTVASFRYDAATGGLTPFGDCTSAEDGNCDRGVGLGRAGFVAATADGRHVYVNAPASSAVAIFGVAQEIVPTQLVTKTARIYKRRAVRLKVSCPRGATGGCLGALALRGRGKWRAIQLGPLQFDLPAGKKATLTLTATGKPLKRLRRTRRFKAFVSVTTRDAAGNEFTYRRFLAVRR